MQIAKLNMELLRHNEKTMKAFTDLVSIWTGIFSFFAGQIKDSLFALFK